MKMRNASTVGLLRTLWMRHSDYEPPPPPMDNTDERFDSHCHSHEKKKLVNETTKCGKNILSLCLALHKNRARPLAARKCEMRTR